MPLCSAQVACSLSRRSLGCAGVADFVNLGVVLGFDALLLYCWGFKALMYLLVGVVAGGGLHPLGGHLIAEHYMFLKVSTCSCACI